MFRMRWMIVLSLLGFAGACKSGPETAESPADEAAEPSKDLAKFKFGWEGGTRLDAKVRKKFRKPGGRSATFHSGYRLTTEKGESGIRVEISPKSKVETTGTKEVTVADALATASSVAMPSFQVTSEGAFDGAVDVESTRKGFRNYVRELKGGSLEKRHERALKPLLGEKFLADRARQFWSFLVGTWAGSEVAIGETQKTDVSDAFQFPVVGRREVELELEFTVEERISCSSRPVAGADESEPECVRISMSSRPDVQELKPVMQKHVDRFAKLKAKKQGMDKPPKLTVTNVFLRSDRTLVTEPATLRPHRWSEKKTVRMTLEGPNGEEKSYKLVDKTRTVFSEATSDKGG